MEMAEQNWEEKLERTEETPQGNFLPLDDTFGMNLCKSIADKPRVAIVGLSELDGENGELLKNSNAIRKQLYEFSYPFKKLKTIDLGNIKTTKEKKYEDVSKVMSELVQKNIIPILIGGSQELVLAISDGVKGKTRRQNITLVDSRIRLTKEEEGETTASNFLNTLFRKDDVEHINLVGLQNYYCAPWQEEYLKKSEYVQMRLRELVGRIQNVEPMMRDADIMSFDIAAVRNADARGVACPCPNGLNGVEACQIGHYAGVSDRIMTYGMFGYEERYDEGRETASLMAQVVWHIIEGIDHRYDDYPYKELSHYQKYEVLPKVEEDEPVNFYNNVGNGRWWIEIPMVGGTRIFACTYDDYLDFCNDRIPDIWMRNFMK